MRRRIPRPKKYDSPLEEAIALIEKSWPDDPTDHWGYGLLAKEEVLTLLRSIDQDSDG